MAPLAPIDMAQSRYVNDVLGLNPLGYWRLDGNANDATANGNSGVLVNGVTFAGAGGGASIGDPSNQAALFTSVRDQYINMPGTASGSLFALDWNHPVTMMIWVKTADTAAGSIPLAKEENSGNYRGPYLINDNG